MIICPYYSVDCWDNQLTPVSHYPSPAVLFVTFHKLQYHH